MLNKKIMEERLAIKLSEDSYSQLDKVLSSILNAENLIGETLLTDIFKMLSEKECTGFYYIILVFIKRIMRLRSTTKVEKLKLSEVLFKQYMNINSNELIQNPEVSVEEIGESVQEPVNMDTSEGIMSARRLLFSYCMEKFRAIRDEKIDITTGHMFLSTLFSSILNDYSVQSLRISAIILESGLKVGSEFLQGGEGYSDFNAYITTRIEEKRALVRGSSSDVIAFNSIEDYNSFMKNDNFKRKATCSYGFPPIDKLTPVYNTDIINITAMEGTGKTTYCCGFACREIMNGFSSIFMCGESELIKVLHMVLSHYIYLKTADLGGYEIGWDEIAYHFNELPAEWKAIINECRHEFFNNPAYGKLLVVPQFSYNNFKREVLDIVDSYPGKTWGHLIIDHTNSLTIDNNIPGGMWLKDRFAGAREMFSAIKDLKTNYHIPTLSTTHLKTELEKEVLKGKDIGTRIGAGTGATSTDVDVMLFMYRTESLKKKNLVAIEVKKMREVDDTLFKPFAVRREFTACNFFYSDALQAELVGNEGEQATLEELKASDLIS